MRCSESGGFSHFIVNLDHINLSSRSIIASYDIYHLSRLTPSLDASLAPHMRQEQPTVSLIDTVADSTSHELFHHCCQCSCFTGYELKDYTTTPSHSFVDDPLPFGRECQRGHRGCDQHPASQSSDQLCSLEREIGNDVHAPTSRIIIR
jgi:hypothetical protein